MAQYLGETKTWIKEGLFTVLKRDDYCTGELYPPHCNNSYEILFVLKGSVQFDMEGEHIVLQENCAIVISPLTYQIVTGNDDVYHRGIFFFQPSALPEDIRGAFIQRVGKRYAFSSPEMTHLFRKYVEAEESGDPRFNALKDALFTVITHNIAFDDTMSLNQIISTKTAKLRRVIEYLDENITSEVRIRKIAEQLHISQSAVYRMFKEELRISLKQYILQKKMIYAETLLRQGVSPGEVARACGYRNYASFYKVFVKITGKTPGKVL